MHCLPDRTLPLILAVPFPPSLPHCHSLTHSLTRSLALSLTHSLPLTDVDLGGFIGHQRLRNQDALSIAILFSIFLIGFFLLAKYFEKKFPGTSEKGE